MIRFRHQDDERRYLALRSEVYLRVAQHLPPALVSEVMRNLGKLEQLLHLEGVRQGLAVAALSMAAEDAGEGGVQQLKAFQAHAFMYGSQDTPLTDVENERLSRWECDLDASGLGAWLDQKAMRYAPQTLSEWEGEQRAPMPGAHLFPKQLLDREGEPLTEDPYEDDDELFRAIEDAEDEVPEWMMSMVETDADSALDDANDRQERPDDLDRLRTQIQGMRADGWEPKSWQQLIMDLHVALQTDAGFLDIQLSTQMGLTVLAQCGIHLHPGEGLHLVTMMDEMDRAAGRKLAAPPEKEEPEGDGAGAAEDDGTDPDGKPSSSVPAP